MCIFASLLLMWLTLAGHGRRLHSHAEREHPRAHDEYRESGKFGNVALGLQFLFNLKYRSIIFNRHISEAAAWQEIMHVRRPVVNGVAVHRAVMRQGSQNLRDHGRYDMCCTQDSLAAGKPPRNAYLHIPFCRRRCFYCDFPIKVVGDRETAQESAAERYVALLTREIAETSAKYGHETQAAGGLETIYFGGGTPSLLPPALLCKIIAELSQSFGVSPGAEVTLEMDPGTFDADKLAAFVRCGVNRVSLGVQSVHESLLQAAGRAHTVEDVFDAVRRLNEAGIDNWSLDLISGLPHETIEQWQETLEVVLSELQPPHVSIYDLQVEPGTAFAKWYTAGVTPLPEGDETAEMYKLASRRLTAAGYQHYEVSSYALPGFRSRHNSCYWKMMPFFGMGLGASSYLGGQRFGRPKDMTSYKKWVENMEYPSEESEQDELDLLLEEIMVALRTSDGLDLGSVAKRHGHGIVSTICDSVREAQQQGLAIIDDDRTNLRLSSPDGFLVSNDVISTIFAELTPD